MGENGNIGRGFLRVFLGALFGAMVVTASAIAYPILDPDGGVKVVAGYPSFGADVSVSVTATSSTSGLNALAAGLYVITCTEATHADQGATGVVATTSERLIPANTPYPLKIIGNADDYLALIRNATSGTCIVSKDTY